ncbi:hypothetical protein SAMN05216303_108289 [Rhodoferax sp. OV413]|uniref:DUF7661 family protein n=1 Tax=Rhodoferax sp. OV413 TaxID=1855285 RepID=UPI000886937A|nr:hypothetical protein [Rhodoferax sp. OV413]SDP88811.1 hypothetical protein SAMN05216303_108289 [Rhodoferax sp. OV413]
MKYVFNVFGRIVSIERHNDAWTAFHISPEGKRRPVELAVPSEIDRSELAQYLYDVYHEDATPTNGDVSEILPK